MRELSRQAGRSHVVAHEGLHTAGGALKSDPFRQTEKPPSLPVGNDVWHSTTPATPPASAWGACSDPRAPPPGQHHPTRAGPCNGQNCSKIIRSASYLLLPLAAASAEVLAVRAVTTRRTKDVSMCHRSHQGQGTRNEPGAGLRVGIVTICSGHPKIAILGQDRNQQCGPQCFCTAPRSARSVPSQESCPSLRCPAQPLQGRGSKGFPSCLHTVLTNFLLTPSSQTVPHSLSWYTSTRQQSTPS